MKDTWRLLDTGVLPAAHNMALERVLLEARYQNQSPNTLHFLQFSPRCVLLGYHQAAEMEIEEEYCRSHGIEINRRISGGGTIFFDESQLGWEIAVSRDWPGIPSRLEDLYRLMCESAARALRQLGVNARFRPHNDIEVEGRKISGTGGTEKGSALLYHGSLLTDFDVDTMIATLKIPVEKLDNKVVTSFRSRVTCLKEILGHLPPVEEIKQVIAEGFAETFGIELQPAGLNDFEEELMAREVPIFESDEWIHCRRLPVQENELRTVNHQSPGGLIRVSMRIDDSRKRIKSVFVFGDFFAYPQRSIMDLEACLKNHRSDMEAVSNTIHAFFRDHSVQIPGVKAEDFCQAIGKAILQENERMEAIG